MANLAAARLILMAKKGQYLTYDKVDILTDPKASEGKHREKQKR
jgi:hypothetical protein